MKQTELLKYAESHAYYKKGYAGKHYPAEVCHNMNMFDERVRVHENNNDVRKEGYTIEEVKE